MRKGGGNAVGVPLPPRAATIDEVVQAIQGNGVDEPEPDEDIMDQFRTLPERDRPLAAETAVGWDRLELVKLILAEYPEIANRTDLEYDDTLLINAIVQQFPDMAVYLVSVTSPQTLLHVVPIHPAEDITTDGATALHLAVAVSMTDVVRAIVAKNEDTVFVPNVPDGLTPIDIAGEIVDQAPREEIQAILLEPTRERGRGARNAALVGVRRQLPHPVEAEIASYLTGIGGFIFQQQQVLRRRHRFQEPPQQRRDIAGGKRMTRKKRRTTSSRRRRTLSRVRLASS
jgi:hypothetical protein